MKKGFTLIELLAVIVILAIIALIATPIVLNIINDAKESALARSTDFYIDAVEYAISTKILNGKAIEDGTYDILESGNICLGILENKVCKDEILEVKVEGQRPNGDKITIKDGQIVNYVIKYGDVIVKNEDNNMLEGNGQTFHRMAPSTLSFRSQAPLSEFQEVQINGQTVSSSNYTLTEGSTIVTLSADYLQTLNIDKYEITVVSKNDNSSGNFSVIDSEKHESGYYYNQPYTYNEGDVSMTFILDAPKNTHFGSEKHESGFYYNQPYSTIVGNQQFVFRADGTGYMIPSDGESSTKEYFTYVCIEDEEAGKAIVASDDNGEPIHVFLIVGDNILSAFAINGQQFDEPPICVLNSALGIAHTLVDSRTITLYTPEWKYTHIFDAETGSNIIVIFNAEGYQIAMLVVQNDGKLEVLSWYNNGVKEGESFAITENIASDEDYFYFYYESYGGYGVYPIDQTKATYDQIPTDIHGKPVVLLKNDAFRDNSNLTSINIPNSITEISNSAFSGCTNLTSVNIPNSITKICDFAFEGCTNLNKIIFAGTVEQWNTIEKRPTWNRDTNITEIICSDGRVPLQ